MNRRSGRWPQERMLGDVSDETLVKRALAGSDRAWTALVRRYDRRVFNYAFRMSGNAEDARDLSQEVFLGVFRNLGGFRGDGAFAAWLFRIAAFRCTDYLRRRRPTGEFIEASAPPSDDPGPQEQATVSRANRRILAALDALPATQRHVVELKFFQQFTFEDIGVQLGISPNTAKTRLYGALKKLKQHEELKGEL